MARTRTKPVAELVEELRDLVTAYVKQETVEPAKRLGRNFGLSLGAGLLMGTGFILLVLAVIRFSQVELFEPVPDSWESVYPYLIGLGTAIAVVVFSLMMVRKPAKGPNR